MTDGFRKYEEFARIKDGEVFQGEFHPPPDVDLSDEEMLQHRYSGPGVIAGKKPDESTNTSDREADKTEWLTFGSERVYQCTMCGTTHEAETGDTDAERWMPCPECGKDRIFVRTIT